MTELYWGKMTKWLKMTQNDSKNDWKGHEWDKLTMKIRKKWKGLEIIKYDQKWQSVMMGGKWQKMTENDWKWHNKDQSYILKLMWYFNINCSTF